MDEQKIIKAFYYGGAININKSRIEHLDSLNLDLENKTVFETGCGGRGDFTKYLLSKNCEITLNDARENNILYLMKNIDKKLPYNTWDLNKSLPEDKKYDIIFSYGLLYHLYNPMEALRNLSNICTDMFIISTCTNGKDDNIEYLKENGQNQAYSNRGCRPGRNVIVNELRKYFEYVYVPINQPNHPEFPKKWPSKRGSRFVLVASRNELNNEKLSMVLPISYK